MREIELLAPAGNAAALHAAVTAGADAVYLGLESFNARQGADNFTLEGAREAFAYAHLRGVRVYVTLNTVVLPSEVKSALECARQAYRAGADAFIVQDIGLASELARTLPQARLHISTQMNTHNEAGIEAARRLGAQRVTLARELSLQEIARLSAAAAEAGLEVEAFAHGALCVCYSGQCFMSSMIGGRSANRGRCAQACRLPYELVNRAQRKPLDAPGEHLLSPQDLCTIDLIPELAAAGVSSLKIEGRMKSADYIYAVTSVYRAVLDRVAACHSDQGAQPPSVPSEGVTQPPSVPSESIAQPPSVIPSESVAQPLPVIPSEGGAAAVVEGSRAASAMSTPSASASVRATAEERRTLEEAFSRGFTTAYLEGRRGNDIMSYGRPNNRGAFVGRVASVRDGVVTLAAEQLISEGDVLEFWTNKGHFAHVLDRVERGRGREVRLAVDRPVGKGDRVFRVRSAEAAFADDALEPRVPVAGTATLKIGEPLAVRFAVADGRVGEGGEAIAAAAEGAPVEAARTKAVTAEDVRAHIDRLGQTPFRLTSLDIELDEGVGIGFSQLHRVRADALDALAEALTAPAAARTLPKVRDRERPASVQRGRCRIAAWATNPACARAAKRAGADFIYVPALNYKRGESTIAGQRSDTAEQAGYPKQCIIALPAVDHDAVEGSREAACGFDPWGYVKPGKPVFADSLGAVVRAADAGALVEAGPHLPLANRLALETAADLGVQRAWLSPELTLGQIADLAEDAPVELGLTIAGAQELMVCEHCLLMSQGPCSENCAHCARRKSPHVLKDRKGYEFPVITDVLGRSHLYNGVALDVVHALPDLIAAGVSCFMVDTTLMNKDEASAAVARAVRARDVAEHDGNALAKTPNTTSGHLFRGVQ